MPKLTPASVKKLKAKHHRREIPDAQSPGLYLIIQKSGVKSFAMRFRNPHGRRVKLTLGRLDLSGHQPSAEPVLGQPLTLVAARRLASEIHRQRALGTDVVAVHKRERLERMVGRSRIFAQAALDFTEQYLKRNVRRWQAAARLLGIAPDAEGELQITPKGLADRWRDRPVAEITGDDIHHVVDEVRERAVPGLKRNGRGPSDAMARQMFALLSRLFRWLMEKRRVKVNPVADVIKPRSSAKPRTRVLSDEEIKKFWTACEALDAPASQCLKLLLLTGCRLNEIALLSRAEVDENIITIPSARSKNKLPHVLPLSPLALGLLQGVRTTGELYFTGKSGRRIGPWSRIKKQLDGRMRATDWVLHDLRRTFSTGCNRIGIAPHVVEACLNHISGHKAGVAGTYNQYAYLPEKTAALQRWSEHISGLVEGRAAKVVAIKRKRTA